MIWNNFLISIFGIPVTSLTIIVFFHNGLDSIRTNLRMKYGQGNDVVWKFQDKSCTDYIMSYFAFYVACIRFLHKIVSVSFQYFKFARTVILSDLHGMLPYEGMSMNPNSGLHQFAWSVPKNIVINCYIKGLDDILSMPGHPTAKMSATSGYVTPHMLKWHQHKQRLSRHLLCCKT